MVWYKWSVSENLSTKEYIVSEKFPIKPLGRWVVEPFTTFLFWRFNIFLYFLITYNAGLIIMHVNSMILLLTIKRVTYRDTISFGTPLAWSVAFSVWEEFIFELEIKVPLEFRFSLRSVLLDFKSFIENLFLSVILLNL